MIKDGNKKPIPESKGVLKYRTPYFNKGIEATYSYRKCRIRQEELLR